MYDELTTFFGEIEWNTNGMYIGLYPIIENEDHSKELVKKKNAHLPEAIEYAICMKRFPSENQLDQVLDRDGVSVDQIREFGSRLAKLQSNVKKIIKPKTESDDVVSGKSIMVDNIQQLMDTPMAKKNASRIQAVGDWLKNQLNANTELLATRARTGKVRELHGDLHSGNLFISDGRIEMFDCLEFNDELSQIDVANDIAFLFMDLYKRNKSNLAWEFMDSWLESTGDFEALRLVRTLATYRAIVRCKIAALSAHSPDDPKCLKEHEEYLALAELFASRKKGCVIAMVGKSGSGKSHWAAQLASKLQGVRIRSDVERKRLFSVDEFASMMTGSGNGDDSSTSRPNTRSRKRIVGDGDGKLNNKRINLYTNEATDATYDRLHQAALAAIKGMQTVILDASFLSASRRQALSDFVKQESGSEAIFVHCDADDKVLQARIKERSARGPNWSDADLDVLAKQKLEPFTAIEQVFVLNTGLSEPEKQRRLDEIVKSVSERYCL